ncbi:phenazine biosynthesis protein-like protein phzf family [Exophiala viscosa]|uniref:Phenazine biosynthesis protein-like protein phzf family n=1 Tax=Exophiala viscosa TaxID=2486360 RepID=A0AAN6DTQ0_9EURO|nr:phenazine biosynthesis protein-like protein phzf family [Exophiala viscosa]
MSSPTLSFVTLDVFTTTRYTGNPLAIIRVPQSITLSQTQKQRIAREFNLSESVFLHEQTAHDKTDQSVRIDIFTSQAEVPFAGHPTVGTANYLLRLLQNDPLNNVPALQAKAGRFPISLVSAGSATQIGLAHDVHIHNSPFADQPLVAQYPVVSIVQGMTFILAELPDLNALADQKRNPLGVENVYSAYTKLDEGPWRKGLVGTYFFVDLGIENNVRQLRTRMFATREDPATGSAASALTSYLSLQQGKPGRYKYLLTQGVEMGQRSQISVEVGVKSGADGLEIDEVLLSGSAVLTMQGTLEIPEEN